MSARQYEAVLDVGKTHSKLSLWETGSGRRVAERVRRNGSVPGAHYRALDAGAIEHWLCETLREFASLGAIGHIVPVAHGAAAALLADGQLLCPPMDYEQPLPPATLSEYRALRDPFSETGSPALPSGLNLGAQLYWLESLQPKLLADGTAIVPWAQYWAWRLSGVTSSERTSLGSHTDLWNPWENAPSRLAVRRGWASRLAPLRSAGDVLGGLRADWAERTHLATDTRVLCGLHDSNAALLAARAYREIAHRDATVVSTGTWFIAMRAGASSPRQALPPGLEQRDCLINVDVAGHPVPSARFMGGRECELLLKSSPGIDSSAAQGELLRAAISAVRSGSCILPTAVRGVGPYPNALGQWLHEPSDAFERAASVALYLALLTDAALELIGAREHVLIEGRYSGAEVYLRSLAALRPQERILASAARDGVASGALQLLDCARVPSEPLRRVEPLGIDLTAYRAEWRAAAATTGEAA